MSALRRRGSSPLSACFHPSSAVDDDPQSSPPFSGHPNTTDTVTYLYQTHVGVFSLSWSRRSFLRRSLHLHFYSCHSQSCYLNSPNCYRHSSPFTFRLDVKPLTFWRKQGSEKISQNPEIRVVWDLTHARFGSGPDPDSGFYVAVVISGDLGLLVGDSFGETVKQRPKRQILVSRRENLFGNKVYCTKARIKGKNREIRITIRVHNQDAILRLSVDNKRVLQIKRLQWKFRGNEKMDLDGATMRISWDVYNWLFGLKDKTKPDNRHALFLLRFENPEVDGGRNGFVSRTQNCRTSSCSMSPYGGPVMEWQISTDEEEMSFGHERLFTLLVYAWRK